TLKPIEYFRLWHGIEMAAGKRQVPLLLAAAISVEAFDPPIFAAICSPDLNTALARIKQYKPLIGPINLALSVGDRETSLTISCYGYRGHLPSALQLSELVFFTQLARLATRESIVPTQVVLPELPQDLEAYQAYFGCPLVVGDRVELCFSARDATRPFLTANAPMWNVFAGGLNRTLKELSSSANTVEKVQAVLMELLPAGVSSIDAVAEKLALSKRTLQRKLTEESDNYHSVLQTVRSDLAEHYLNRPHMSLGEISFLLGYQEVNSFIRAFTLWKGVSPGSYRAGES
ncbi:helix-turn-helix domain-containing protein, partial [Reinekea sp.]|uniref:helix-turn-helix domain-containing protein n=1 Tax=Reinekea sp. TaxID=1970455 RepID=UPI002A82CE2B